MSRVQGKIHLVTLDDRLETAQAISTNMKSLQIAYFSFAGRGHPLR
jgi:hypothetical protein